MTSFCNSTSRCDGTKKMCNEKGGSTLCRAKLMAGGRRDRL